MLSPTQFVVIGVASLSLAATGSPAMATIEDGGAFRSMGFTQSPAAEGNVEIARQLVKEACDRSLLRFRTRGGTYEQRGIYPGLPPWRDSDQEFRGRSLERMDLYRGRFVKRVYGPSHIANAQTHTYDLITNRSPNWFSSHVFHDPGSVRLVNLVRARTGKPHLRFIRADHGLPLKERRKQIMNASDVGNMNFFPICREEPWQAGLGRVSYDSVVRRTFVDGSERLKFASTTERFGSEWSPTVATISPERFLEKYSASRYRTRDEGDDFWEVARYRQPVRYEFDYSVPSRFPSNPPESQTITKRQWDRAVGAVTDQGLVPGRG